MAVVGPDGGTNRGIDEELHAAEAALRKIFIRPKGARARISGRFFLSWPCPRAT